VSDVAPDGSTPLRLTSAQEAIASTQLGTVLVLAAVGTGKTTVLTERISRAVREGQDPSRVLAVTFTNRAATHLREGLTGRDPVMARSVQARTFHSLCAWILRSEARSVGLLPDFWIYDEDDSVDLLREIGVDRKGLFDLQQEASSVPLGAASVDLYYQAGFSRHAWAREYVQELTHRGAVDFSGLVLLARALLTTDRVARERWAGLFDVVTVDEIQDTHLSEYEVLRTLASNARSLCLVGDLDQTIYSWRGSEPGQLLEHLERDFGPVQRLSLEENFRATRQLLAACDRIASGLNNRATHVHPHPSLPAGQPPTLLSRPSESAENTAVAQQIADLVGHGVDPVRVAVLTRTNRQADAIAASLRPLGVPHTTVEDLRFFRRREIKDLIALLHLTMDTAAEGAARRVALRLVPGVGRRTVRSLLDVGGPVGLRVADLFDDAAVKRGDPFWGYYADDVVVVDTETTGLSPQEDEVVEIAAIRLRNWRPADRFHRFVRPGRSVGDSQAVHGWSDEFLAAEGGEPRSVFEQFVDFLGQTPVAGHNVGFDVRMLESSASRSGLDLRMKVAFDTLLTSRRLLTTSSYRLGQLAQKLDLDSSPTHQAMDDVKATIALAEALLPIVDAGAAIRSQLVRKHSAAFAEMRRCLEFWRWCGLRPTSLARDVVKRTRVLAVNADDLRRHENIEKFLDRIGKLDEQADDPLESLRHILDRIALSREVDQLDEQPGVRLITVHQAKGLEFEQVFVPGMVEDGFPSYYSKRDGKVDEERRLFYVAATRACRGLHLSLHEVNDKGWRRQPSRFLDDVFTPDRPGTRRR
jgi:DNA helicase II / ATP-dependent DNA helicase PcrA